MSVKPIDVPLKANYMTPNGAGGVAGASTKIKIGIAIFGLILVGYH